MILDNVDDDGVFFGHDQDGTSPARAADMADHNKPLESVLPQTAQGTILVTSRNSTAAANLIGGHSGVFQVEPMDEDEALALLHTRVPFEKSERTDAKELVHALECIPLAVTQAAAHIKTRASTTTISTYLELFRESEANQVHLLSKKEWKDIRRDHSIQHAVIATWQISFEHIQKKEPSAADLLTLISMFDKQGIPRSLLQGTHSQLDFDDALMPLLSFSLVKTEIGEQIVEMHRLVQLSMKKWLEAQNQLGKWVKESIQALSAVFPDGDYQTWKQCEVLLPHVKEMTSHATEDEELLKKQAQTILYAACYLLRRGEYSAAEAYSRLSLDLRERVLGREHPDTLASVSNLGTVLERQGKYDEAEAMHRRALEEYEKVLRREHSNTLNSVSNLRVVLLGQGKYKEAEAMHRRDLEGSEKALRREHSDTLSSVSNLRAVLERQEKYEEAEAMHQQALEGRKKVLRREHPHTLSSVSHLGVVLERQGKYDEAEAMHRRALEGSEKVLGPEHPNTLSSVTQLAFLFHRQQQFSTAHELYERAYRGYIKALGAQHSTTKACFHYYESARKRERV